MTDQRKKHNRRLHELAIARNGADFDRNVLCGIALDLGRDEAERAAVAFDWWIERGMPLAEVPDSVLRTELLRRASNRVKDKGAPYHEDLNIAMRAHSLDIQVRLNRAPGTNNERTVRHGDIVHISDVVYVADDSYPPTV